MFNLAKRFAIYLGYFGKKISCQDLRKLAQFGHTAYVMPIRPQHYKNLFFLFVSCWKRLKVSFSNKFDHQARFWISFVVWSGINKQFALRDEAAYWMRKAQPKRDKIWKEFRKKLKEKKCRWERRTERHSDWIATFLPKKTFLTFDIWFLKNSFTLSRLNSVCSVR